MSLEDALKENTEVMKQLVAVYREAQATLKAASTHPVAQAADVVVNEASKPGTPAFNYDDHVKKPFLQLLNTKREAAMKLLADLGVSNLKGFENQPEKFAELSQKIQEAQNG